MKKHPETFNSYEWAKKLKVFNIGEMKSEKDLKIDECLVLDPDGWDRTNLDKSYSQNITKSEFLKRLGICTVIQGKEWGVEKKKHIKYSPETKSYCIDTFEGFAVFMETYDVGEKGKIDFEIVELTETEFLALPEFTGF